MTCPNILYILEDVIGNTRLCIEASHLVHQYLEINLLLRFKVSFASISASPSFFFFFLFRLFCHAKKNSSLLLYAAAIEKELWATGTVNEEYLKALNALFNNFPRLRATEPATLSIPHLVTALKTGSEATQEAALDALFLLRQAWSACPAEVSKAQSVAAADAIPLLQYLIQSGPPRFQEKAEFLLQCLPGTLVVIIKRGNNMKQSVGNPSVYCKLTLGNTPPRQTKVRCFHF